MRACVVVVGGGPVGMLIAAELGAYGVDTVVFEALAEVTDRPKATTLHARTVQCLVRRGRLPWAGGGAQRPPGTSPFHFAGMPGLVLTAPGTEPEPLLKCRQADLERDFEAQARAAGVRVLRGHRVTRLRQDPHGVRITAHGPRGEVECEAGYVVGADGARSTVRELAGIDAQTWPATVSAMTGVVALPDPGALDAGWHRTPRGWIVVTRLPGGGVHVRTLDCSGPAADRDVPPTLRELRDEAARIAGLPVAMEHPRWLGRFSDFSRLADTYRQGRVLLAGDAAHVHFPIGGQGLSTGLLDAVGLGWKLAHTVLGTAGEGLLDSYGRERRPAALRVIGNTRAQLALMRPDRELDELRALFGELTAADSAGSRLAAMVSAQDTVVPPRTAHPSQWEGRFLVNRPVAGPPGGADVISLLRSGRPLLLLFGEPAQRYRRQAAPWAGLLHVVRAEADADAPWEAVLVRPDGYIGWAPGGGGLADALTAYFGPPVRKTGAAEPRRSGSRPAGRAVPPAGRGAAVSSPGCP